MKIISKDIMLFMRWLTALAILSIASSQLQAQTADNQLRIKPARCIALHEGQTCYQTLKIEWQAEVVDSYCLFQQDAKAPLFCWDNLSLGRITYEFEGEHSSKFFLVRKRDNKTIAEFSVEVAWVYDSRSRRDSHWRIF
jgi:hypothetical protein